MTCQSSCGTGRRNGRARKCLKVTHITSCRSSSILKITIHSPVRHSIALSRYKRYLSSSLAIRDVTLSYFKIIHFLCPGLAVRFQHGQFHAWGSREGRELSRLLLGRRQAVLDLRRRRPLRQDMGLPEQDVCADVGRTCAEHRRCVVPSGASNHSDRKWRWHSAHLARKYVQVVNCCKFSASNV